MLRMIAMTALAASLAGCSFPTTQAYQQNVQSWVGRTSDSLVLAWGAPDRSFSFSDGTRQLEYDRQQVRYIPGFPVYNPVPAVVWTGHGGRRVQYVSAWGGGWPGGYYDVDRCLTRFRVGPDNRVREVT